jgi:hypothetical protein
VNFAGIWCPVHPSSVSSNSLPTYLRSTCLGTVFSTVIMSWRNLSPCSSLTPLSFFWKKTQVWHQKVDFQTRIVSHRFVQSQQVLHNILTVRWRPEWDWRNAWLSFTRIWKDFLGNRKTSNYQNVVKDVLTSYKGKECNMILRIHFLKSHLDFFSGKSHRSQ